MITPLPLVHFARLEILEEIRRNTLQIYIQVWSLHCRFAETIFPFEVNNKHEEEQVCAGTKASHPPRR